jgi:hypothetical protein
MSKTHPQSIDASCPVCAAADFEVRALTAEGLANVKCIACDRNYLLLDSEEYWFDAIQGDYPRVRKCSCGSTSFRLRCDYSYRETGDVRAVDVSTSCAACAREKHLLDMDINYSGTERLVEEPLKYCENPKVLYDLQKLTLYVKREDIARIVNFLAESCQCSFVGWLRINSEWVKRALSSDEAKETVRQEADPYLMIYAHRDPVDIPDANVNSLKDEDIFWKRHEIIRISSPTHIGIAGVKALLFYIDFANEFVDRQIIVRKSGGFVEMTDRLLSWLKAEFVAWRGPRCFDNPDENIRVFGDRFTKRRKKARRD